MRDVRFADQRTVTDRDFFEQLKLPGDLGKRLAAALKADDMETATQVVAQHFRTRSTPRWPFYMHGTAWMEIDGRGDVIEKADGLLENRFKSSWPDFGWTDLRGSGDEPDWSKISRAGGSIGRATYVVELSTAFALTGRTKYLRKAFQLMRSFVSHFPFILEEGFFEDQDRYFGGRLNEGLTVTYRALRWIDYMHCGALQIPGLLSDADVVWLVKQIWFWAMQFYRLVGSPLRRDNHHLVDHGHAPFVFGVTFPEFSVSREMVREGKRVISHHFGINVFADGSYAEHSTKYQYHILYHYLNPLALSKANNVPLFTEKQVDRLRRWTKFSAYACQPNGILAQFGDEYGGSLAYLFGSLVVPVMDKELAAMSRALGYEPGKLSYETPAELTRIFRDAKDGEPKRVGLSPYFAQDKTVARPRNADLPKSTSIQYPNGGYTFFRDEWSKDADFFAISHYTDSMPHGHTHWDPMHFILHTQGRTLIGDPATWLYGRKPKNADPNREYRGYHYAMDSHNVLVMNDDTLKPLKALGHPCCWGGYPPRHGLGLLQLGGDIEVAEMWHDAFAPTRHRRFVVHLKGIGIALVDMLWREGLDVRPHQYSQRFHFETGVDITPETPGEGQALRATAGAATCLIVPGLESQTSWKTWRDEYLAGMEQASDPGPWVAEVTRRTQGPTVFTNFLLTRPAIGREPSIRYLGKNPSKAFYQQHEPISAHELDLGPAGRLLIAACPYGQALESDAMSTDAQLAVILTDGRGRVRTWALANGSRLSCNGRQLAKGKKKQWAQG